MEFLGYLSGHTDVFLGMLAVLWPTGMSFTDVESLRIC